MENHAGKIVRFRTALAPPPHRAPALTGAMRCQWLIARFEVRDFLFRRFVAGLEVGGEGEFAWLAEDLGVIRHAGALPAVVLRRVRQLPKKVRIAFNFLLRPIAKCFSHSLKFDSRSNLRVAQARFSPLLWKGGTHYERNNHPNRKSQRRHR